MTPSYPAAEEPRSLAAVEVSVSDAATTVNDSREHNSTSCSLPPSNLKLADSLDKRTTQLTIIEMHSDSSDAASEILTGNIPVKNVERDCSLRETPHPLLCEETSRAGSR